MKFAKMLNTFAHFSAFWLSDFIVMDVTGHTSEKNRLLNSTFSLLSAPFWSPPTHQRCIEQRLSAVCAGGISVCSSEHQNRNANTTDRAEKSSTRLNVSQWKESEAEMVVCL